MVKTNNIQKHLSFGYRHMSKSVTHERWNRPQLVYIKRYINTTIASSLKSRVEPLNRNRIAFKKKKVQINSFTKINNILFFHYVFHINFNETQFTFTTYYSNLSNYVLLHNVLAAIVLSFSF